MRTDSRHLRFTVSAWANALYTTRFTHHFLSQRITFTAICNRHRATKLF
ncbi:Uncharacterised protein [Vibrio cholerae]|nr:Uncharacterised protein [Vibrio cholerae]